MTTVRYKVQFGRVAKPVTKRRDPSPRRAEKHESVPLKKTRSDASAARLLAVAHFVEQGLNDGSIPSFRDAVAMVGVSRVRLCQIMKLLDLCPGIQEAVLTGKTVAERRLRELTRQVRWAHQANSAASPCELGGAPISAGRSQPGSNRTEPNDGGGRRDSVAEQKEPD